jgi:hypothetical protein
LSAAQKQQVTAILQAGLAHYVAAWQQGQRVLGSTQYADGDAGLTAMDDPNSAAARFSAWRHSSGVEQDVTAYQDAFKQADAFFNADNEPTAIGNWRDDVGTLQTDITTWVSDAVNWQVRGKTDAQMAQDVGTINSDIAKVTADATATVAA